MRVSAGPGRKRPSARSWPRATVAWRRRARWRDVRQKLGAGGANREGRDRGHVKVAEVGDQGAEVARFAAVLDVGSGRIV